MSRKDNFFDSVFRGTHLALPGKHSPSSSAGYQNDPKYPAQQRIMGVIRERKRERQLDM